MGEIRLRAIVVYRLGLSGTGGGQWGHCSRPAEATALLRDPASASWEVTSLVHLSILT